MSRRSNTEPPFWYACFVAPQHEFLVRDELNRRGFEPYLAVRREYRYKSTYARRLRKAKEVVDYALIPRLILIGFPFDPPPWLDLFEDNLIQSVLGVDGKPRMLTKAEVGRFVRATDVEAFTAPEYQKYMPTHGEFRVGDRVTATDGAWRRFEFEVEEIKDRKAKVLGQIMGRPQRLVISVDDLEKIA